MPESRPGASGGRGCQQNMEGGDSAQTLPMVCDILGWRSPEHRGELLLYRPRTQGKTATPSRPRSQVLVLLLEFRHRDRSGAKGAWQWWSPKLVYLSISEL